MATKKLAQGKGKLRQRAERLRGAEGPNGASVLAAELRLIASQLYEAVDNVIVAQTTGDVSFRYDAFTSALSILTDARFNLSEEAGKLEAVQL